MARLRALVAQFVLFTAAAVLDIRGAPILSLRPITSTVGPGNSLMVNVSAAGITNLYAFQFDVNFAPGVLAAASVNDGAFLEQGGTQIFVPGRIDNSTGAIQMTIGTLVGAVPGVSGDGVLTSISFVAL